MHPPQFVLRQINVLKNVIWYRGLSKFRQRLHKIAKRVVPGISLLSINYFAFKRQESIPRIVKGKIATEAEQAIPHRLIWRSKTQNPHFGMKHPTQWSLNLKHGVFQIAK